MGLIAWMVRVIYRVCCLFPQRRKIVFLSRQASRPFDFVLLEPELKRRFPNHAVVWSCVAEIGQMSVLLMVKQIWHVATADLCLVDGYVPAVSLPLRHRSRVIQIWHAPGAIKKFGYQAVGTPAGRSRRAAESLRMHRGYDYVVAGMPGAVTAFAEAFDMPVERILPLGLPRIDYLRDHVFDGLRAKRFARAERAVAEAFASDPAAERCATTVLYAPTFRKNNADGRWMEHAVARLRTALEGSGARLLVAGHPLDHDEEFEQGGGAPVGFVHGVPTIDVIHAADYVVTDYSTVAFEAGYARKPVLFYVPDIEEYRASPGLNIDPARDVPTLTFDDASAIAAVVTGDVAYDNRAFTRFMENNEQGVLGGSIGRIVDLLEHEIRNA